MSCRHGILGPLSLTSSIWKPLSCEALTPEDLLSLDKSLLDTLTNYQRGASGYDGELLIQAAFRAAGSRCIEQLVKEHLEKATLCANADTTNTCVEDASSLLLHEAVTDGPSKDDVCELLKQKRLTRHALGLQHILRGIAAVIPAELLAMFTPQETDELFCGHPKIDLEVLKKATVYEDVSPTARHVQIFWECMQGLSQDDRAKFINFASGRSRLPASAEAFPMKFKLQAPPPQSRDNPDRYLPKVRTKKIT